MITPLDQPMDPLDNMTPEEAKALEDWEEHFKVFLLFLNGTDSRQNTFLLELLLSQAKNRVIVNRDEESNQPI
jgi:hypothetical protein